jgi:hypothetical protein
MSDSSWDAAMTQLAAAQRDFMNGDATGLQALYRLSSVDARVDQHTTHHVVDDAFDRLVHELDRLAAAGEADQGATGSQSRRTH